MADGDILKYDEYLMSQSGAYKLIMQSDCNLVIYDEANNPMWETATYHSGIRPCSF